MCVCVCGGGVTFEMRDTKQQPRWGARQNRWFYLSSNRREVIGYQRAAQHNMAQELGSEIRSILADFSAKTSKPTSFLTYVQDRSRLICIAWCFMYVVDKMLRIWAEFFIIAHFTCVINLCFQLGKCKLCVADLFTEETCVHLQMSSGCSREVQK